MKYQIILSRSLAVLTKLFQEKKKAVFLYMGGSAGAAFHPAGVVKISDTDIYGFDSPAIPKILDISNTLRSAEFTLPFYDAYLSDRELYTRRSRVASPRQGYFNPIAIRGVVNSRMIEAQMDMPASEIAKTVANYDLSVIAILVRTYGSFTFDRRQIDAILEAAKQRDMIVFATNPFPTGRIDHEYVDAQYLITEGAIPLHMMSHAASVKLLIAEALFGGNKDIIEKFMVSNNFIGEQPPKWTPRQKSNDMRELGYPWEAYLYEPFPPGVPYSDRLAQP